MRTFHRLRLLWFDYYALSWRFSSFLLFALSKPGHPHQKKTWTKIKIVNSVITITSYGFNHISFWWRCRESNPSPEHFSITFNELGVMVSFRLCYRILGSYHHIKQYCIRYYDTCQYIYSILPGNVFCPLWISEVVDFLRQLQLRFG